MGRHCAPGSSPRSLFIASVQPCLRPNFSCLDCYSKCVHLRTIVFPVFAVWILHILELLSINSDYLDFCVCYVSQPLYINMSFVYNLILFSFLFVSVLILLVCTAGSKRSTLRISACLNFGALLVFDAFYPWRVGSVVSPLPLTIFGVFH